MSADFDPTITPEEDRQILCNMIAAARAEVQQLREERKSLIAEMNTRHEEVRNDRQRLYERIWAAEAEVAHLRSELETALKDAAYHSERRQHFKIEAGRAIVERDRLRSLLTDATAAVEAIVAVDTKQALVRRVEVEMHDMATTLLARLRAETPEVK